VADEEFDEIEGGIGAAGVIAIIGGAMGIGAGLYTIGQVAGERAFHAGLRNRQYQSIKWSVRAGVNGFAGPIAGSILMAGFENKFYSMR
jgi:hypothetical protein